MFTKVGERQIGFSLIRVSAWALVCALACAVLDCAPAEAAQGWFWKRRGARKVWGVSVEAGLRYETHYNRETMITTVPGTILGEIQMTFWNRNNYGIYVTAGKSVAQADTTIIGGGLKLPFLTLSGSSGGVSGISMMLVADLVQYTTADPVLPQIYDPSQLTVRYGGAIHWRFGKTGLFLDTTMMVHSVSDNFFIAPLVGLGFHF